MYPQRAIIPLQGLDRCALTVGAISGPTAKLEASLVTFHQLWIYMVGKKYSEKADQLTFSGKADQLILASGGSEHA